MARKREPFREPMGGIIGHTGIKVHYQPKFRDLDKPLAGKKRKLGLSAVDAIVQLDYKAAVQGDLRALARTLWHFADWEIEKIRKHNIDEEVFQDIENYDCEHVDEALSLLGIVVEKTYKYVNPWGPPVDSGRAEMIERQGPGVADWLLEVAFKRPSCPECVVGHYYNWVRRGGLAEHREFTRWGEEYE